MTQPPTVRDNRLCFGAHSAEDLAGKFGTPLYVYEEAVIRTRCGELRESFKRANPEFHYAVKANFNPALLAIVKDERFGIDAVSPHEVRLALELGFQPAQILFTGNNVTEDDLAYCIAQNVPVNLGSLDEIERYGRLQPGGTVSVRLNPDVGAGHHHHVITGGPDSKFGIYGAERERLQEILRRYRLRLAGIHAHIGSGILRTDDMLAAMEFVLYAAQGYDGLDFIDFGGGFGVPYRLEDKRLALAELGSAMSEKFLEFGRRYGRPLRMKLEPGRYIVAESGTLLARVTSVKSTSRHAFVGTDSGFNHLVRPIMYGAYHRIVNATRMNAPERQVVVAGNICEAGDVFTQGEDGLEDRPVADPRVGDLLAIQDTGAYGMCLSSQYNLRPRPPEVLITGDAARLIRRRESYEDLMRNFEGL
jgi:diaminopimelate decarboxylase